MPRKPRIPDIGREVVPVAPKSVHCEWLCMDVACDQCWNDIFANVLDDMGDLFEVPPMRVSTIVEDDTFEAILAEAFARGVTVSAVVRGALREWAAGQGKARR